MSAFNSFVSIITVLAFVSIVHFINKQALMMNKEGEAKDFKQMGIDDKDLVMFTITDLKLEKNKEQVHMVISLKRKIQTEMLTTYLPTLLLLIITYATTFFKAIYFEASLTVNLTIMLVMTTIFTSKIEELPPTSDTKMIDIWLIFCLLVPFAFTLVQTAIEYFREEETETLNERWAEARGKGKERETSAEQEQEKGNKGEEIAAEKVPVEGFFVDQRQSLATLRTLQKIGWQ